MAFSKEIQEKFRKIEEQQDREWAAMTEPEKEQVRIAGRRFAKKVDSCYPPDADYSISSSSTS